MAVEHKMIGSGAAYAAPECTDGDCMVFYRQRLSRENSVGGEGHALCSCGERSPHLRTYRERLRWHREHHVPAATKATVAA